ncbi:hypothetical protein CBR_g38296 [Chara braunii]|uniref:Reverse transcriptase domain-containing protein n=1 Tax=Chara braunii TaxID=69332 RepID=A0A388LQ08_CHABU|nr:hypothetical protein CBR_g38296 [Chara braunii]|eukprot:GBG84325.1 hypothetical protein CBR_g38296 [Chara braunii]
MEIITEEQLDMTIVLLDLEKAYDRVSWPFVLSTLRHMGIGPNFCEWVKTLYFHATASIMINGRISPSFPLIRSVRQGCPLAPLLFVMQMDVLLNKVRCNPYIVGLHTRGHLQFKGNALADDLTIVSNNTANSLRAVKETLVEYCALSEAQVNWSKLMFFLPEQFEICVDFGMKKIPADSSERFLGVQVSLQNCAETQDRILVGRVEQRLLRWKTIYGLSLFGRALIVNAAVFSQLWYSGVVKPLGKKPERDIRTAASRYIWKPDAEENKAHMSKISWEKLTAPQEEGGLAVLDPVRQNKALLGKWSIRVALNAEDRSWVALAEYILAKSWGLCRGEDVVMLAPSYQRRRPKSPFSQGVIQVWKTLALASLKEPQTRDEVLRQPLFENQWIKKGDGSVFTIAGQGSFGRSWVERGVLQIEDLWDEPQKGWRSTSDLRRNLGRLWHIETRRDELIQAIPEEWKQHLGDSPSTGRWYRPVLSVGRDP